MEKIERIRELLLRTIKEKSKSPLWEVKQIWKTMTDNELSVMHADEEIFEMTMIIDRNILPKIDSNHVSFGPPIDNPYE